VHEYIFEKRAVYAKNSHSTRERGIQKKWKGLSNVLSVILNSLTVVFTMLLIMKRSNLFSIKM